MTDLERFFRQIVRNLTATDPARLHRPLPVAEIRDSIVPYRANRRALELESSEDYELILMRLCAGEGSFATTEPEEVRAVFAAEIRSSNPDLEALHRHENVLVRLEPGPVARALSPDPGHAFAPPDAAIGIAVAGVGPEALPEPPLIERQDDTPAREPDGNRFLSHCAQCGGPLPVGRVVNFCPHCGGHHVLAHCPACRAEAEAGWRHCIACGTALTGG